MRWLSRLFFVVALSVVSAASCSDAAGRLVIVGGALSNAQDDIFEAFLVSDTPREALQVAIIPVASSKPTFYGEAFRATLVARGLRVENIHILPLAVRDDRTSANVDESTWAQNGNDPELVAQIEAADLIWFTGGDQSRITQVLGDAAKPSTVLTALYAHLETGGMIGGTSAGAAIMSPRMLIGGSSAGALSMGIGSTESVNQEDGSLYLGAGLGFLPDSLIDQHFDAKARLGRLILAGLEPGAARVPAFGIDENTALVVDLAEATAEVAGAGQVTYLDFAETEIDARADFAPPYRIENIQLSSLGAGDAIDLKTGAIRPAADKEPTVGREYYQIEDPESSGVLSGFGDLQDLISKKLIDNKSADRAVSYLILPEQDFSYQLEFSRTETSRGYWTYRQGQVDHYTVVDLRLDIRPVSVSVNPL